MLLIVAGIGKPCASTAESRALMMLMVRFFYDNMSSSPRSFKIIALETVDAATATNTDAAALLPFATAYCYEHLSVILWNNLLPSFFL